MSAGLEPAWVLSQRPYGNSGKLLELFTLNQGRLGAVARGVHRKAHGGQTAHLLQPFQPLLVATRGRGELKTLSHIEAAGLACRLEGNRALCGFYLNELLLRLLARFDPHPQLFSHYGETLNALITQAMEPPLRYFEVQLLAELGYRISWDVAADGAPIDVGTDYQFYADAGFLPAQTAPKAAAVSGRELIAIHGWLSHQAEEPNEVAMTAMKQISRLALAPLLGDRPLQTRLMAGSLNWGGER